MRIGIALMTVQLRLLSIATLLLVAAAWFSSVTVSAQGDKKDAAKPVESDMHESMEYVFEPTYKRLKPAMASAPADNKGWKAIKADSLILAESGNLLLIRQPDKDA